MSMRNLWFLMFVLAPLATLAGYGSTYGIGSAGGGVTVGNAVSGGTASRLLFNDASGLVSTATPALGDGLTLTGAASVGTTLGVTGATTLSSTADIRGNISNGGSASCAGVATGILCATDSIGLFANNAGDPTTAVLVRNGTTAGFSGYMHYLASSGVSFAGRIGNWGSTHATTAWRSKVGIQATGLALMAATTADVAENAPVFTVFDNTSEPHFEVEGDGAVRLNTSAAIPAGDCDADAEVGRIRRYAKDANNITLCTCQKVGGVFGWAGPVGGDCT